MPRRRLRRSSSSSSPATTLLLLFIATGHQSSAKWRLAVMMPLYTDWDRNRPSGYFREYLRLVLLITALRGGATSRNPARLPLLFIYSRPYCKLFCSLRTYLDKLLLSAWPPPPPPSTECRRVRKYTTTITSLRDTKTHWRYLESWRK